MSVIEVNECEAEETSGALGEHVGSERRGKQ